MESPRICYSNGKVVLAEPEVPLLLQNLLSSQDNTLKNFHDKIHLYNSAFTFASVGIRFDHKLTNMKSGIYTFHVQGSFYHRIDLLLPESSSEPHYLQMYIWDTQNELHHRTNIIPNSNLNPAIVQALKEMFGEVNPYVINLRYISKLHVKDIANLIMLIHTDIPGLDQRTHNVPTAPQVKGAKNYKELKVVDNVLCATFKESAQHRGFLENDDEHRQCMAEAREFQMSNQLRNLFATLLVFGDIADDFAYRGIPEDQLQIQAVLQSLNIFLQRHMKTVADYDLPELFLEINIGELPRILLEKSSYHITPEDLAKANMLNEAQRVVFDE
ncbi:11800_t:CDS:2, partial [Acaulospora colombiana]